MKRRYAVRSMAIKQSGRTMLTRHCLRVVVAHSEEEAEGIAWRELRRDFPIDDGWESHDISVLLIEDPWTPEVES